jgi:hypothetical protein
MSRPKTRSTPHPVQYQKWDEDRTISQRWLYLDAATYKVDRLFPLATSPKSRPVYTASPQGSFAYMNCQVAAGTEIPLFGGKRLKRVVFNGPVTVPALIDLTRWSDEGDPFPQKTPLRQRVIHGNVWMSLTPGEMISQRSGVQRARGKVVVGGLGLGWFLRKVCDKPEVEEVVVVEQSRELLDWYGFDLCKRDPKVSEVICDDIYSQIGKHGPRATYLLDIWPLFCGAELDSALSKARKRHGPERIWAWGLDS